MKSCLLSILYTFLAMFLLVDLALAIKIGLTEGWKAGILIGIPAYIGLSLTAPFILLFAILIPLMLLNKIEEKIKRSKKYQY